MEAPFVFRFTRDLRLDDHAGLVAAASHGPILPVLVIDRALEAGLSHSPRRAAFYCAAVHALDASLRERGTRLILRRGPLGPSLRNIARATGAGGVAWSASYDGAGIQSDERLQSDLEEAGLRAAIVHDAPAIGPEETAQARSAHESTGYRAFAAYFDTWRTVEVASYEVPLFVRFARSDLQSEPLPTPNEFGAQERAMEAGPAVALEALRSFLRESVTEYALTMNVPSEDRTSHLSAHLSFGTIAARTVVRATIARAEDPFLLAEERASIKLFLRSLAQRDFFLQLSWFHPRTQSEPLQEKMKSFTFARAHVGLDAWRGGRTGFPLVDAGVRQLHETGWMHPHVRAVAASFCCFDLGVDWRVGRDEWDRWTIEDDRALATGNWQWIAGVGADMAQYPRIYNPERQRRRFDPTGAYVKRFVPELAQRPLATWAVRDERQLALDLFATPAYPLPILDHEGAARSFLARYRAHVAASISPEDARRANR
ncbi:MAG: cryptochrome/photolyase family protein [Vulcanimicrobiaceae bacterium]